MSISAASVRSASEAQPELPVDTRWFSTGQLAHCVTVIEELRADQRVRGNFFLVETEEENLLVDSGLGLASLRSCLPRIFERPLKLLLTHAHYDHQGGAHEVDTRLMHRAEIEALAVPSPTRLQAADFDGDDEVLCALSRDGRMPLPDYLLTAHPEDHFDADSFHVQPTTPTGFVDEGDVVEVGDRRFVVVHLPGHTDGSVGLIEEATGVFFSGDAIYEGPILDFLSRSNIADYVRTMERMKTFDVQLVLGGHGPPLSRHRMTELIDDYLKTKEIDHA